MSNNKPTGVYTICCVKNWKYYIGSTVFSFKSRWKTHRNSLNAGKHKNTHLQRAWVKYGADSFEFVELERCPKENCLDVEQKYLDLFQSYEKEHGYNIRRVAKSNIGVKANEITRERLSRAKKGIPKSEEFKAFMSKTMKGRKYSPETIQKMSNSRKGKKLSESHKEAIRIGREKFIHTTEYREKMSRVKTGFVHSEESKRKMSLAQKGKVISKEAREKMSKSKKGKPGTWIGRKHTEETKVKLSEIAKQRDPSTREWTEERRIKWLEKKQRKVWKYWEKK